jgi:hypothetical protein
MAYRSPTADAKKPRCLFFHFVIASIRAPRPRCRHNRGESENADDAAGLCLRFPEPALRLRVSGSPEKPDMVGELLSLPTLECGQPAAERTERDLIQLQCLDRP